MLRSSTNAFSRLREQVEFFNRKRASTPTTVCYPNPLEVIHRNVMTIFNVIGCFVYHIHLQQPDQSSLYSPITAIVYQLTANSKPIRINCRTF